MLHDLDQPQKRTDDSNGGSESSGGLEALRDLLFVLGLVVQFQFHDLAQLLWFGSIDCQHHRLAEKSILDSWQIRVERDNAFLASLLGKMHQELNGFMWTFLR